VTLANGAGTGAPATAAATLDKTAPAGYSIAADQETLDNTTASTASFTFTGAEAGANYTYTVTSDGGKGSVTGSGTISSSTQQVSGINVAMLPNGTLTYSVILTDAAGNAGSPATATAALNQTIPAGYTMAADQSTLNATTATSAGFTFANAAVGATYSYTITSSGDSAATSVTGSGTVISATQDVTGINVSSLPDGALTFSVTLTNGAGTGAPALAPTPVTLDKTAPAGYSILATPNALDAATATSAGFTFSGAESGTTYSYTISSSGDSGATSVTGSGPVTSATQVVSGISVSSLPDGTLTFSVALTDLAGNIGPTVTATATLNQTTS